MIWYIIKMYQAKNPKLLRKCSVILCSIGLTVVHGHLLQRQINLFYNILIKSWFKGDFKFPWRDHEPIRTIYYSLNWNGSEHFSARWTIFRLIRKWTLKWQTLNSESSDSPILLLQWIPYGYVFLLIVFWNLLLSDTRKDHPVTFWSYLKVLSGTNNL